MVETIALLAVIIVLVIIVPIAQEIDEKVDNFKKYSKHDFAVREMLIAKKEKELDEALKKVNGR